MLLVGCQSSERALVRFSYVVEPEKGLPPGVKTIAIVPAKVGPTTDPKWSEMSATILHALVDESRSRFGTGINVVDRRDTQVTFDEADLAAAGMSTRSGGGGGQLLAAEAAVLSNINVKVESHVGKQRTLAGLDLSAFGGHRHGGGGVGVDTTEVETVTRSMTVQTEFKLVDTANNRVWEHYSPRPYQGTDRTKASPIFGSSQTSAELTPEDEIVAELVERAARDFVSRLMPCRIDVEATVYSSGNKNCVSGVKMLRGELFDQAITFFQTALGENPDDHRAAYGAGIACEATGRSDEALKYYQMACAGADLREYRDARERMQIYGNRVRGG
jgi:hypothetical protein